MKPLAERAVAAIVEQLRTILVAAGYELNIGLHVYRAKHSFALEEVPGCAVFETTEVPDSGSVADDNRTFKNTVGVEIVVHVLADRAETGTQLGLGKADVKRALMSWAANYDSSRSNRGISDADGQIGTLVYFGATALARQDGAQTESVSLRFAVALVEAFGNPYGVNRP